MPKPVCVKCQRFFRCKKNSFNFTEGAPIVNGAPPGTAAPEQWRPYKIWASDLWACPGCGVEILSGFGKEPLAVQHEPDFAGLRNRLGADYQVNDC